MIELKCYEFIGMYFFMLFFLIVNANASFILNLISPKQRSGDFLGIQAFTILEHLMLWLCSKFSNSLGSFLSI